MPNKRVAAWKNYIPNGVANAAIKQWHEDLNSADRVQDCASPSTLLDCPRVVWLKRHKVPVTNVMGWGKKQRLLLGRQLENMIADQFDHAGILLWHWKDDAPGESIKFTHGERLDKLAGTPDLLLQYGDKVVISDAKTSRSDSFLYVPTDPDEIWQDYFWYKYKLQLTAYYMLCHWNKEWFSADTKRVVRGVEVSQELPLPELCHLFSYALDDGIVRRDISWQPSEADVIEVIRLTRRWNAAYNAETMPECTCQEHDGKGVLFCSYGIMPSNSNVCVSCCNPDLEKQVVKE